MIRKFGEPTVVGSAALTAFVAAGVAGSLAGGWLADRWQRLATIRLGYAAAIPALAVLAVAPDVAVAFGAAIVAGLALFTPFAAAVTLGQDYLPNRIGTASGSRSASRSRLAAWPPRCSACWPTAAACRSRSRSWPASPHCRSR